ncbi:NAD(+) synthase [Geotalea toluenoxydans]|uniref:NAD(+) synthase n=1 Tax=Geotalea toluenoxydans TaxID=421624 RepID=UPI002436FF7C|nr:NAD(+) synthase [Geotalea toluenoxydans]
MMSPHGTFSAESLKTDVEYEAERICTKLRTILKEDLKRRGIVIGVSGGIDSSVTAALAVRALGRERVYALEMPERHSADETKTLSSMLIEHLGVESQHVDITGILEAVGFYQLYDDAVRMVVPEYGRGWKSKIVTSSVFENNGFNLPSLVAQSESGCTIKKRLPLTPYLHIVAATNYKQRIRKMIEYYHADRLHYAVAGTPNRLEYDQGFFVKLGDGAADIKPIAHLYKSQVYQLAGYLGIPEEIRKRPPTTDTYSLSQKQDEFYFSLPYQSMDLCLMGKNKSVPPEELAALLDFNVEQVQKTYNEIDNKRSTTRYLHLPPLLVQEVPEVSVK